MKELLELQNLKETISFCYLSGSQTWVIRTVLDQLQEKLMKGIGEDREVGPLLIRGTALLSRAQVTGEARGTGRVRSEKEFEEDSGSESGQHPSLVTSS